MPVRRKFWKRPSAACASVSPMIQAASKTEQIPSNGDDAVVARSAELCNPFLDELGDVTLVIHGAVASSALNWSASLFRPVILPLLQEVMVQAASGGSFEICALDCRLDAMLPAGRSLSSRDAGKRLCRGLLAPRGDRMLERYRTSVLAGDTPGHLAVIHTLRASVFHLPPQVAIASYLFQEGVGAGLDGREISRFLIGPLSGVAEICPEIRPLIGA